MISNSIVDYLEKRDPSALRDLTTRFPGSEVLDPNFLLGIGTPTPEEKDPAIRQAKLALVESGVKRLKPDLEALSAQLKQRLRLVARTRLIGGAIAAAAGALGATLAVVTKGLSWHKEAIALGTSLTAMLGGICTVMASYWETSPNGSRVDATQELSTITDMRISLDKAMARVRNDVAFPIHEAEIDALIKELDEVSVKLLRLAIV